MLWTRRMLALVVAASFVAVTGLISLQPVAAEPAAADPALARTRKQVQMLDDLYKSAIVLITDNYVTEKSDLAAGDAFQALFKTMKDKGYHEVRLIDATGEPYDDDNAPKDDFEKAAIKALKAGKPGYEKIVEEDGQRYLRSATPIPVVLKKCTICHEHYADVPDGQPIGSLGYKLKIE
ncbi:MAG: DUF3365 domain-containing protein [Planctomycetaceae bacterium]